nr:leucine-rich repeat and death domain-containing protein 1-like [Ziziphus jujuba var. spinosa]
MEVLPNSITRLQNLQTLNLSHCWRLRALPRDITKLVNFRHLYPEYWGLTHLSHGLGRLTNLQTLPVILLREDSGHGGQLNELKNLNNLRGKLKIVVDKDGIESKGADLRNKEYIQSLELSFWSRMGDDCEDLVPHPNLKELSIKGAYVSDVLLNCVGSLHNLVKFELWAHKECQYLASFNHLPCLKVLKMRDLPALDYISSDDNLLSSSLPFFPSLQQLSQDRIPNLKGWWKSDEAEKKENARILPFFPRLSKLSIMDCPNLISMPPFPYLQEYLRLQNTSIKPFQETLLMETNVLDSDFLPLSKLKTLNVSFIQDLQHFPVQLKSLTSLKELNIIGCPKLQSLSQGFHHLTSLQQVHIRHCEELDMPNGNDAILWHHLGSLSRLELHGLPKPVALPQGLQQVTSPQEIKIFGFENFGICSAMYRQPQIVKGIMY